MKPLHIESTRGDSVESVHALSVAVTDVDGRLLARAGNPSLVTFWRSAAKPFQALPMVVDGAADHFGFTEDELALTCASHSSERVHLEVAERMLARLGLGEEALACGPHPPLGTGVAELVARSGLSLTPRWSNCSGKHAGMLALALHHGWPVEGYERWGHPVQARITETIAAWSGVEESALLHAVDGCTAVCFGLPLSGMATAYARFGASQEPGAARLRAAMMRHPQLVAGTGRLCTDLMRGWPGGVIAKVGAEGIYSAAIPGTGVGIALKVEDGDMRAAPVALLGVLRQLLPALGIEVGVLDPVAAHAEQAIRNTRGEVTGALRCAGSLERMPQGAAK